jgi:hypothetical protein
MTGWKKMRVEFDVFSGRPNPSWELTVGESGELIKRLKILPAAKADKIRDGLGYRGIVIIVLDDEVVGFATLVVSAGVVLTRDSGGSERLLADRGRTLERWLLGTARGRVDPEIYALIEREVDIIGSAPRAAQPHE